MCSAFSGLMSFDLPRNAKGLRFTGDVKALVEPDAPPSSALGKPRQRNAAPAFRAAMAIPIPSPPPASVLVAEPRSTPLPPPSSRKDVYRAEIVPTPYVAPPPVMQAPRLVRREPKDESYD